MKVGLLGVGKVDPQVLTSLSEGLQRIYPDTACFIVEQGLPLHERYYDKKRNQYNSTLILNEVSDFAVLHREVFDRVLGVVDVDLYVSGLNYVFGEAYTPGCAGLISLWRLRPEFYGESRDWSVFVGRVLKEAVHEIGHTLGLPHCHHRFCVMHFSNSIFDTDKKQTLLCDDCYIQAALAVTNVG